MLVTAMSCGRVAVQGNGTAGERVQAQQSLRQRTLARADRPGHCYERACRNLERDLVQGGDVDVALPVDLAQQAGQDDGSSGRFASAAAIFCDATSPRCLVPHPKGVARPTAHGSMECNDITIPCLQLVL